MGPSNGKSQEVRNTQLWMKSNQGQVWEGLKSQEVHRAQSDEVAKSSSCAVKGKLGTEQSWLGYSRKHGLTGKAPSWRLMAAGLSEGNMEKQDFQKEIDTMDKILEIFDCR